MKRCPFCKRIVWFWQSKCYLDAKSKKPCHTICFLWDVIHARTEPAPKLIEVQDDTWKKDLEV